MTQVGIITKKCAVCGKEHEYPILISTNSFGSPDLDLRRPGMERDTMDYWIEECPECHYVSSDISEEPKVSKDFLKSESYLTYDGITFKSNIAKKFYRDYLIKKELKDTLGSCSAIIHTAWACDDAEDIENAKRCREIAISLIEEFDYATYTVGVFLKKLDLLRRAEKFDQVIDECKDFDTLGDQLYDEIVRFQVAKAKEKDSSTYTLMDAHNFKNES